MDTKMELSEVLQELKGEQFHKIFEDHQIDVNALKYMTPHHLDQVIPRHLYGPRIIFEHHLKKWQKKGGEIGKKSMMSIQEDSDVDVNSTKFDEPNSPLKNTEDEDFIGDISTHSLEVKLEQFLEEDSNSTSEVGEEKSTAVKFIVANTFPVEAILKESFIGEQILEYYAENKALNSKCRAMLGNCIVEYLVHNKLAPQRQQFSLIAESIVEYFTNEDKDIYYFYATKKRKPGGILYSRYHNYLQKLRKDGINEWDLKPMETPRHYVSEYNLPPIEEILQGSLNGKLLLDFYAKNSILNSKHRPMLSSCIIQYIIENKLSPKREHFGAIAENIVKYFKTENKDLYYTTPPKNKKPGGMLYAKYHNQLHKLREGFGASPRSTVANVLGKRKHAAISTNFLADTKLVEDRDWLKDNFEPLEKVLEKWQNTYNWRISFIEEKHPLEEILQEWPLYKQSFGYKLVDADFSKEHPDKTYNLYNKWENFRKVIMCLLREVKDPECVELLKEFSEFEQTAEFNNCLIFYLIHAIIKPTSRVCTYDHAAKKMKHSKSSKEDSRNSFMIVETTYSQLNERLSGLIDDANSNKETFPPVIGGVGESMFDITEYYVYFGNVCYKLENLLSSVDAAFKIYNVLNLDYPRHCKGVWLFIQEYFFEIKISADEKTNALMEILNDLKIRKV